MNPCEKAQTKKRAEKMQREAEKRCFWSWPWGHCFCINGMTDYNLPYWQKKCCHCGKKV